ncbi:MAG: cupin domain-containing protein [Burkholderiales bacterium]|nr:cupin domain-containing protein [Burkholderiales bacterium]
MKTTYFDSRAMQTRIARFKSIPSQKNDALAKHGIPVEAMEMIAAKDIMYYLGPKNSVAGASGGTAPAVDGQPGLSVYVVKCPPGQGPMLHAHQRTHETFFCLDGRWEVRWNDDGSDSAILEPYDMIAVPVNVSRAFRNVSEREAHLLVMIQGDPNDMTDVAYAPAVGAELVNRHGPQAKAGFEKIGVTFDAGV